MSRWVSSLLLFNSPTLQYQVKSFKKLVNVAERLVELRNYNSAAAVIGGLSVSPVSRLERLRKVRCRILMSSVVWSFPFSCRVVVPILVISNQCCALVWALC